MFTVIAPASLQFRALRPDDTVTVRGWLLDWLRRHVAGWTGAYGLSWDEAAIDAHVRTNLLEREYAELAEAATAGDRHVELATTGDTAQGLIYAELRRDRYLGALLGVISWIYVAPAARRHGIGAALVRRSQAWMRSRGATAVEVFVTAAERAATATYAKGGLRPLDLRMVAALVSAADDDEVGGP